MFNILYIDDQINYYCNKLNKIITYKPYKGTIENGLIIDTKKFSKIFKKMLVKENIKCGMFYDKIIVITPPIINSVYKNAYKNMLSELNFKIITFKNELSFYKLAKYNIAININEKYIYYSFINNNRTITKVYNIVDLPLLISAIGKSKNNIYIYGNNTSLLIKRLEQTKNNYYVFENKGNYFINKLI